MSENQEIKDSLTRREVLRAVGKYSAAATGATIVALSAEEAAAQAACSTPNPPRWCFRDGGGPGGGRGGGGRGGSR